MAQHLGGQVGAEQTVLCPSLEGRPGIRLARPISEDENGDSRRLYFERLERRHGIGLALGWVFAASHMRLTRSSMLDVLGSEYVKLARIKGLPERQVIWRHAFKNAALPVVTFTDAVTFYWNGDEIRFYVNGVLAAAERDPAPARPTPMPGFTRKPGSIEAQRPLSGPVESSPGSGAARSGAARRSAIARNIAPSEADPMPTIVTRFARSRAG